MSGLMSYRNNNGETHPTCGDIDRDGRDEIALGLGAGSGGVVQLLESSGGVMRSFGADRDGHLQMTGSSPDQETRPALY